MVYVMRLLQEFCWPATNCKDMYMVVSHWKPLPGKQAEFERIGKEARSSMRGIAGLEMIEAFWSGDEVVVIHGYQDYDAYTRLVEAEDGEIARNMAELGVEAAGEWLGSERGETID